MKDKTIALFYGSSTCYTEMVCEQIAAIIAEHYPAWQTVTHNIADHSIDLACDYDYVLYGIPTWDYGELQEDWDNQWDNLMNLDLKHQQAAVYGLGDQVGYPEWYQDAIGFLYSQLGACGATLYGLWPTTGHTYEKSQGLSDDGNYFLGLPVDEENQPELTTERLQLWLEQVINHFDKYKNTH